MAQFGRLITAMVTPFDREGKVDYPQARSLAQALVESGSDGLVVTGTTGESPTLTREEKLRLYTEAKEAVGTRATILAGTASYGTAESIELSREAERLGVDGLLLVTPYYNKPPQDALYKHFVAIAESVSIPCVLYNVPSRTSLNMAPETTIKLSHVDNIVGVKEASGNLEQIAQIIEEAEEGFLLWSGNDSDTLPILAVGGYGVVSVASHLVGRQIARMMVAFLEGEMGEAARIHRRLLPLVKALFLVANPIPVKYALNSVGFPVGDPRPPLSAPDEKTAAAITATLRHYTIDLPLRAKA
ncbi:MAG: 4-hydroxy-tetrahydrodipicolinate synthase [Chloroflexi bacterium]|nr:4-hydroxy-tetrahydrodipicolinate synthase [Chloroflexota bacterium]